MTQDACWNSGAREMLSVREALAGEVRCSRCGRLLKVRVKRGREGSYDEAPLPRHLPTAATKRNPPRKNPRKVVAYLTQYGYWWSCTPEQWRKLLAVGLRGEGHELTPAFATELCGRPSSVRAWREDGRPVYWASAAPYFRCLDFDAGDWQAADEEVKRYLGKRK